MNHGWKNGIISSIPSIGAAGELFAIRTPLYEEMPEDTLLDDFMLSLRIAMKQYTIAYCDTA